MICVRDIAGDEETVCTAASLTTALTKVVAGICSPFQLTSHERQLANPATGRWEYYRPDNVDSSGACVHRMVVAYQPMVLLLWGAGMKLQVLSFIFVRHSSSFRSL